MNMKSYCFHEEIATKMARALWDGTKKTIRTAPFYTTSGFTAFKGFVHDDNGLLNAVFAEDDGYREEWCAAPYNAGDNMWLREEWRISGLGAGHCVEGIIATVEYRSGGPEKIVFNVPRYFERFLSDNEWFQPVCMPQEFARLYLHVETIRLSRLQDISALGCIDCGIDQTQFFHERGVIAKSSYREIGAAISRLQYLYNVVPFEEYKKLWSRSMPANLRNKYGWDDNPWVWELGINTSLHTEYDYKKP